MNDKVINLEHMAIAKDYIDTSDNFILKKLDVLMDKFITIEADSGKEITANPFAVTFDSLNDISVEGVWNSENSRIEF